MTRRMVFKTPTFHPGLNLTVRKGQKWADLAVGERIVLATEVPLDQISSEFEEEPILVDRTVGYGTVFIALECTFDEIPDYWLQFNHAPGARDRDGLKAAMDAVYEDWEAECTLIFFWY